MHVDTEAELRDLLALETIAVVGCSSTPGKAAHSVPRYLLDHGYEVIPVNPFADEIFGRQAYDSLGEVPDDIDIVNVFRPNEEVSDIVDEVLARHADRGDVEAIWLQLGIRDDDAAGRAVEAGLRVVQDRCLKVDHRQLA